MTAAPPSKGSSARGAKKLLLGHTERSAPAPHAHVIKDDGVGVCHNRRISGGPPRAARLRGRTALRGLPQGADEAPLTLAASHFIGAHVDLALS